MSSLLDEIQSPVATSAVRIILTEHGRPTTAEHLGRLAAYQREDFLRSHVAPPLCWAIEAYGRPTKPRWWALTDWRLERRIRTELSAEHWLLALADWMCRDLADRPSRRGSEYVTLALGTTARITGRRQFDVPVTSEEWIALRAEFFAHDRGVLDNRTGVTGDQADAETRLRGELSGFEQLFGVAAEVN